MTRLLLLGATAVAGFTLAILLGGRPILAPTFLEAPGSQQEPTQRLVAGALAVAGGRSTSVPAAPTAAVVRPPGRGGAVAGQASGVRGR